MTNSYKTDAQLFGDWVRHCTYRGSQYNGAYQLIKKPTQDIPTSNLEKITEKLESTETQRTE